jgi:hypothetical protein
VPLHDLPAPSRRAVQPLRHLVVDAGPLARPRIALALERAVVPPRLRHLRLAIFWADDAGEFVELHLGSFDEIGTLAPQYEIWTLRREPWPPPLDVPQYERDRPGEAV